MSSCPASLFLCIAAYGAATSVAGTTFGQAQPQQQYAQTSNLFGPTSQAAGGLFGATATSQAAPTLFGQQSQAPAAATAFGMQQQRPLFSGTSAAAPFGGGFGAFSTNQTPSMFGQPQSSKPMGIATPNSFFPATTASVPFGTTFAALAPQQSLAYPAQQPGVLTQTQAPQATNLFGQPRPFGAFGTSGASTTTTMTSLFGGGVASTQIGLGTRIC